jgi:hypothetical protein
MENITKQKQVRKKRSRNEKNCNSLKGQTNMILLDFTNESRDPKRDPAFSIRETLFLTYSILWPSPVFNINHVSHPHQILSHPTKSFPTTIKSFPIRTKTFPTCTKTFPQKPKTTTL